MSSAPRLETRVPWKSYQLSDCLELINGRAYSQNELLNQGTPVLRIQNLNGSNRWYYSNLTLPSEKYCDDGDLLFAWSASFGPYVWRGPKCIFHYHIWKVVPKPNLDRRFAFHLLRWITEAVKASGHGATMVHVTKSGMEAWPIQLPPVSEQRRISGILDLAHSLVQRRERSLGISDSTVRATFFRMFGDPVTNPLGFNSGTIEAAVRNPASDIRCGPFGTQLKVGELVEKGIPLLGIENVLDNSFRPSGTKFLTERKAQELRAFDVVPGDVLVTRMGTIGRACVVPPSIGEARFSYHLFRIRLDRSKCIPEFLASTISMSGTFQSQLKLRAHGAIMDGLSTSNLKSVRFLLPPLRLQEEFLQIVKAISSVKEKQCASLGSLNDVLASIQHKAFQGEL